MRSRLSAKDTHFKAFGPKDHTTQSLGPVLSLIRETVVVDLMLWGSWGEFAWTGRQPARYPDDDGLQ